MVFAQLTYRKSLRDIGACLVALRAKLFHVGFRGRVKRSALADANDAHDWRIYADFAQVLSPPRGRFMQPNQWASTWSRAITRSTQRLSTYA
jgi:hypothetical protein